MITAQNMDNVIATSHALNGGGALTDNAAKALDAIIVTVANASTSMVQGAYDIGTALNEAKTIHGDDDVAFGKWRAKHIEPMGISKRTARRMQNVADRFTQDTLPQLGLSTLYAIASDGVAPAAQEAIIERSEMLAASGKKLTAREVTTLVSKLANGKVQAMDVRAETVEMAAAEKVEAPAVLDGEMVPAVKATGDAVIKVAAPVVKDAIDEAAAAKEWAETVRRMLKGKSVSVRTAMLFELKQQLMASKMLVNDAEVTIQVANGAITLGE